MLVRSLISDFLVDLIILLMEVVKWRYSWDWHLPRTQKCLFILNPFTQNNTFPNVSIFLSELSLLGMTLTFFLPKVIQSELVLWETPSTDFPLDRLWWTRSCVLQTQMVSVWLQMSCLNLVKTLDSWVHLGRVWLGVEWVPSSSIPWKITGGGYLWSIGNTCTTAVPNCLNCRENLAQTQDTQACWVRPRAERAGNQLMLRLHF